MTLSNNAKLVAGAVPGGLYDVSVRDAKEALTLLMRLSPQKRQAVIGELEISGQPGESRLGSLLRELWLMERDATQTIRKVGAGRAKVSKDQWVEESRQMIRSMLVPAEAADIQSLERYDRWGLIGEQLKKQVEVLRYTNGISQEEAIGYLLHAASEAGVNLKQASMLLAATLDGAPRVVADALGWPKLDSQEGEAKVSTVLERAARDDDRNTTAELQARARGAGLWRILAGR